MQRELIAQLQRAPELGPEVLVFSGGTAFNETARCLKFLTQHGTHLLTPFDSGGSSASLRTAFGMPAVGDLRSRLMALADESLSEHRAVVKLFQTRVPAQADRAIIEILLRGLRTGSDKLLTQIEEPVLSVVRRLLERCFEQAPADFDYRGASLGNLVLTGAYLDHHRRMDPTAGLFSRLIRAAGTARVAVDADLHLGAVLENDRVVLGQHRLTGKEVSPLESPIRELFINRGLAQEIRTSVTAKQKVRQPILQSALIVYAPGSFYTSLMANLLPKGIGESVASSKALKVWVPNLGQDPEQLGMTIEEALRKLVDTVRRDAPDVDPNHCVTHILFDRRSTYPGGLPFDLLSKWGITPVDADLVSSDPP